MDRNRRAITGGFAFAFPHIDYGAITAGTDVEAIVSGLLYGKCKIGCIYFVSLALVQSADVQIQRPLVQLHLDVVVADVGQGQAGLATDSEKASPDI
jgi:hypothetical protein